MNEQDRRSGPDHPNHDNAGVAFGIVFYGTAAIAIVIIARLCA